MIGFSIYIIPNLFRPGLEFKNPRFPSGIMQYSEMVSFLFVVFYTSVMQWF